MLDAQPVNDEVRLLRLPEVLNRLGVSRPTVYRLIQRKEFPEPVRMGRASAWPEDEVAGYIAKIRNARG